MPICQKFSKGVRLLALHIGYQTQNAQWRKANVTTAQWRKVKLNISGATGLEMRKSKMKCQIDPPMNCGAKQIGKSPVWQFLFNGAMHKSSFAIQGKLDAEFRI